MNYKKKTSKLITTVKCLLFTNTLSYSIWPYDFRGVMNINGVFFFTKHSM